MKFETDQGCVSASLAKGCRGLPQDTRQRGHNSDIVIFQVVQALHPRVGLLTENWVLLLVDVELKITTKPKMGRKKDLLHAVRTENTGDIKLRKGTRISMKGLVWCMHTHEGALAENS